MKEDTKMTASADRQKKKGGKLYMLNPVLILHGIVLTVAASLNIIPAVSLQESKRVIIHLSFINTFNARS
jgi:hypothetical protein